VSREKNHALADAVRDTARSYLGETERSAAVIAALRQVDRADFLPEPYRDDAYADVPLPIGSGQTCSQPSMVALMLDLLAIRPGNRILEIGAGCGYAAAIASILAGPTGRVIACEIRSALIPGLTEHLRLYPTITVINADGSSGLPQYGLHDRILLSAGVGSEGLDEPAFLAQLADDGVLVYPEAEGALYRVTKGAKGVERMRLYGVRFVPLLRANAGESR
jgi:protein-L-isoaspartate(D-aspartate) O-methyltransferase